MIRREKWTIWDQMFGWSPDNWEYAKWPTKDKATFYLRQCPGRQISDPDLPF